MSKHDDHIPADLTPANEEAILDERARMFTRAFWISLLQGREGLGDTFWAGNYLAALFFVPVIIVILTIPPLYPVMPYAFIAFGLYLLGVARAVAVARPKTGRPVFGWRITGVIWTLLNAGTCLVYVPFSAGG